MNPLKKHRNLIALLLLMALIFTLSSQPGYASKDLSGGITLAVAGTLEAVVPGLDIDTYHFDHFLRKAAHFTAYLIFCLIGITALKHWGIHSPRRIGLAMLLCVLYAISDECHQMFVPGRGAQVQDVLLDSAGAGVGAGLYWLREKRVWQGAAEAVPVEEESFSTEYTE